MKLLKLTAHGFLLLCLGATGAYSQTKIEQDKQYELIPAQPTANLDKIEVIEFFYYGCPHCFDLQPYLKPWLKQLPRDVDYRRIPAYPKKEETARQWLPLIKLYYTLETLGEVERLNWQVYDALHIQAFDLREEPNMLEWAEKHGIDRQKFAATFASKEVEDKAKKAKELNRAYQITGTPRMVVDGKYLTSSLMAGGHKEQIPVLDHLIALARAEHASKK